MPLFELLKQETESGYGIMEEPDLTLVSTSDISIAETDLANLTLEERDSEAQSCSQVSAISPVEDLLNPLLKQHVLCLKQVKLCRSWCQQQLLPNGTLSTKENGGPRFSCF